MGRLSQKRGVTAVETTLLVVFEIFLVLAVGASLMFYVNKVKEDTLFQKIHHVKDLSFLVEAMHSVPGNTLFFYNESFGFKYKFSPNRLEITETGIALGSVYYWLAENLNLNFIYPEEILGPGLKNETDLVFKKAQDFEINPSDQNIDFRICPVIETSEETPVAIKSDSESLKGFLLGNEVSVSESGSPLIILKYSYVEGVEIYMPGDIKSMKLACLISNELKKEGINSAILPSDSAELKGKTAVLIESDSNLKIERQIAQGVKRYFEWKETEKD